MSEYDCEQLLDERERKGGENPGLGGRGGRGSGIG